MTIYNHKLNSRPAIDLSGPDGNAFVLIGYAKNYARQIGYGKDALDELINDMTSSDYEHLITVFDNHFGDFVDLYR